jgi:hypothetical protein
MRFLPGGPWIPDRLLSARDAGEVLFFCGAGVSRAKAGLPDFVTLAQQVADGLGAAQHSDARRLLSAAIRPTEGTKPVATVAIDRVFTLLQQEFEIVDVRRSVAQLLMAPADCDLSPHKILLELSRIRTGQPRVITTNFDLLFERAEQGLQSSAPPRLPDPRRPQDFHGVVHLHGAVNQAHDGAEHDEFVLSSGEFGHAYLSDGWATRYIQALLERFIIVFVGYSADDPPVQYLLEAMNQGATGEPRLFAFHQGPAQDAVAQWSHRGVSPISFDDYPSLWGSLGAWADRARDVDIWYRSVVERARVGPAKMTPHERGLVAHLARSSDGARMLATADTTLAAEWLFVFDRSVRYSTPSHWPAHPGAIDPFDALGLDDDPPPDRVEAQDPYARRRAPAEAWDAFEVAAEDRHGTSLNALARLTGPGSAAAGLLPRRLSHLGHWLARVAHQRAAIAWLAGQNVIHPQLSQSLTWRLRNEAASFSEGIREAWVRLMAAEVVDVGPSRHLIGAEAERAGWSTRLTRAAVALYRPHIVVHQGTAMPWFEADPEISDTSLMRAEVEYPSPYAPFAFPADQLPLVCRLFRAHLESAVQLEGELKESSALYFDAIRPLDGERRSDFRLSGLMGTFADLLESLGSADPAAAQREVQAWEEHADAAFTHMRIWASGYPALMTAERALAMLLGVNAEVFWSSEHERDLLLAIRDRWGDWSLAQRARIEQRLLEEPLPWFVEREDRDDLVAFYRLNRLQWFKEQRVEFSFNEGDTTSRLRALSPSWEEAAAQHTAQPRITRLQAVGDNLDHSVLSDIPLDDVVAAAAHLAGHEFGERSVRNPFSGLAHRRPARALRALVLATRRDIDTAAAWSTLLNRQIQDSPSNRMRAQVARRLSQLRVEAILTIVHPITAWMASYAHGVAQNAPETAEWLWRRVLAALRTEALDARSGRLEWVNEAINRPAGQLVDLVFNDSRLDACRVESDLPMGWINRVEALMALPEPQGFYALALVSMRFRWLSWIAPEWTEARVLPWAADKGVGGEAFWSGFLSSGKIPTVAFFVRIKAALLERAVGKSVVRAYQRTVAGMLLIGWRGIDRDHPETQHVTDVELREVLILGNDELRRETLWQLGYWAKNEDHDEDQGWDGLILPFLQRVWPLQRSVRTAASSSALMSLAFEVPESLFDAVVTVIAPRLTVVESGAMMGILDEAGLPVFVGNHGPALLALLWRVLSEDATRWPYGADTYLERLGGEVGLDGDSRLLELQRRHHRAGPH